MALGGGKWLTQNKILPGAYINFVSKARADGRLSDRGMATIPVKLNWGPDGEIFKVESGDFFTDTRNIFGYSYTDDEMADLREIFKHAKTVYLYRLNSGEKAENILATAKYSGIRGNDLKIIISKDVDDEDLFIVETVLGTRQVDVQVVKDFKDLQDNQFVDWKKGGTLTETASLPLENGTNQTEITGEDYQEYLDKIEGFGFNVMGCPTDDDKVIDLFVQYTKRMRDEVGALFQTVIYDKDKKYDHEGIIALKNKCITEDKPEYSGVYWLTGAEAGCDINKSLTNSTYDGEYDFEVDFKQSELEEFLTAGKLVFHRQNDEIRILQDINTFVTFTPEKNIDFSNNQVIRVLDEKGNGLALLFNNKYNGNVPNDESGRESLWADIVDINLQLQQIRAIQNYDESLLRVEKGKEKGSVLVEDYIEPVGVMDKLYTVIYVI